MIRLVLILLVISWGARAAGAWDQFQVIMWQDRTPGQMQGLAALGFTATKLRATGGTVVDADRTARRGLGLPYYLENLATDFYSPYHRYTAGKDVTWLFDTVRARRRNDPSDKSVTLREPSLADPVEMARIAVRLEQVARREAGGRPLFYNIADESGIADLAAAWDFDTGAASLAGFRDWLRTQYASLGALNEEWGSDFVVWEDVQPELTDAALRRADGNFAPWSDFKAWMDVSFAKAVRAGADAVHRGDPAGLAGLEGAQVPGWGGYDYALLAPAVDVMEVYDLGEALDLAMAFHAGLIPLRTSFGTGPREDHAVWRFLLHGGRGLIVWDENDDIVGQDGRPGPRGLELQQLARAIGPVAALLRTSRPDPDPVAILQSQASFRVQWLIDRQGGDHDWAGRNAEREYDDNAWRASRRVLLRRLAELGVQPRFLSSDMLEEGALRDGSVRTLFLPHAVALSDTEVREIERFRSEGGVVLADDEPGLFDGHGRRRPSLPLPGLGLPQAARRSGAEATPTSLAGLANLLARPPRVRMTGPDGALATGVEVRWFRNDAASILTLQAGQPWGAPSRVGLHFAQPTVVTDLRLGRTVLSGADIQLDPIEPTILMVAPAP